MQAIFDVFEPMNVASARDHADFIPGALAALAPLRARGLRIGRTTGYTRRIMDVLDADRRRRRLRRPKSRSAPATCRPGGRRR